MHGEGGGSEKGERGGSKNGFECYSILPRQKRGRNISLKKSGPGTPGRRDPEELARKLLTVADFLKTPAGRLAACWEREKAGALVEDCFGYRALQVGMPEIDFLERNRMALHVCTGGASERGDLRAFPKRSGVVAEADALPFASESFDLAVLPHALDLAGGAERAKEVLREAVRVLIPEGRIVIMAFNPASLWGARQRAAAAFGGRAFLPSCTSMVTLFRLRDWCSLLSLEIDRGAFGAYEPPCRTERGMRRWHWFDRAGDRWWPACGGVMMISAVKRAEGVRLVGGVSFARRTLPGVVPVAEAAASTEAGRLGCAAHEGEPDGGK